MSTYPAYISKYNLNHENQIIVLMIPNGECNFQMAIFIVWIVSIRLEEKTNLNLIKKYVKIKIFLVLQCLPTTLGSQGLISDKTPSVIYTDPEPLIKRTVGWKSNFEKSSTTKVSEHISCRY